MLSHLLPSRQGPIVLHLNLLLAMYVLTNSLHIHVREIIYLNIVSKITPIKDANIGFLINILKAKLAAPTLVSIPGKLIK